MNLMQPVGSCHAYTQQQQKNKHTLKVLRERTEAKNLIKIHAHSKITIKI